MFSFILKICFHARCNHLARGDYSQHNTQASTNESNWVILLIVDIAAEIKMALCFPLVSEEHIFALNEEAIADPNQHREQQNLPLQFQNLLKIHESKKSRRI